MNIPTDPIDFTPSLSASELDHARTMLRLNIEERNRREHRQARAAAENILWRAGLSDPPILPDR